MTCAFAQGLDFDDRIAAQLREGSVRCPRRDSYLTEHLREAIVVK
jgi:hypothetical protein